MGFVREQRKHRSKENRWYPTTEASITISLQVTRDKNKDRPENWWNYTIFIPPRFALLILFLIFIPSLENESRSDQSDSSPGSQLWNSNYPKWHKSEENNVKWSSMR